ncbi:hypothetical protein GGR50DRAFT_368703 [Xylaria sp. CBS 124048]|nr:hypothetical protein GGR50DRAFT_368703 [Xylaria sp. CBS 124048]
MASNNDNAMTRFLFAILRQKNLKDIDWNQVAHDPILAQEITNGHAARMRYSRFKSAMLGLEPTRRNRSGPPKPRAGKSKKETKNRKDDNVKAEPAAATATADAAAALITPTESPPAPSLSLEPPKSTPQKIKQESSQYSYNDRLTPASTPGPIPMPPTVMPNPVMLQNRHHSPCGDADKYHVPAAMTSMPTGDMVHAHNPFDFHACPDHMDPTWTHGAPSYFATAYPFDDYANAACDHQHLQHALHTQCQLGLPAPSIEADMEDANVKREEWSRYD